MKHLIIIGAGGAGRETYYTATRTAGFGTDFDVKGFLDDNDNALDQKPSYPPILSSLDGYSIVEDDVVVCAIANPVQRWHAVRAIDERGGTFITLIDHTASIGFNVNIGKGCVIREFVVISPDVTIGSHVYIQPYTDIGHDAVVGDCCLLNTRAFMGGHSRMERLSTIHTHGALMPMKTVGEGGTVGAGSVAIRNVKSGVTVVGVPARELKL